MKKRLLLLAILTAINTGIYIFRDDFQFVKYSTYQELYSGCNAACRDKWADYLIPYSEASLNEARTLLHSLRLDTGSALSKINGIGHHLYTKFRTQNGYPQPVIHHSAPMEQYRILSADTTQKLWCGTYAQMFAFLCWSQNIVCRNVEIFKPGDHHVFNECFVPETGQWMMVDVTNNLVEVLKEAQILNAQDFVQALQSKTELSVVPAQTIRKEAFEEFEKDHGTRNYYRPEYPFYYYNKPHLNLVYSPMEKLKRYVLPVYWYEIFSPEKRGNFLFYGKLFFLLLWLILAGSILFKIIK